MSRPVIGYCHRPEIPHTFLECLVSCINAGVIDQFIHERTFFIASGRNKVVKQFLKTEAEWLLFVDDDIIFRPDQVNKIMELADPIKRPILAGLYLGKLGPGSDIHPIWLEEYKETGFFRSVSKLQGTDDNQGLQEIDVCGMGFTLIHRSVFETMEKAAPALSSSGEFPDEWTWFGHDLRDGIRLGEDTTFCVRAKELGYPIYGVSSIQVPHLKQHFYTVKMFLDQEDMKEKK